MTQADAAGELPKRLASCVRRTAKSHVDDAADVHRQGVDDAAARIDDAGNRRYWPRGSAAVPFSTARTCACRKCW